MGIGPEAGSDQGQVRETGAVHGNRRQVRRPGAFALTGRVIWGSVPRGETPAESFGPFGRERPSAYRLAPRI